MADLSAGLTVAVVAIPLAVAIAIASGAEPGAGLLTAVIAGFLISAFGGSRVQIGGPTGAFIVVVYSVIAAHGYDGLVIATFMAGTILIAAGFLRAGRLVALVPDSVIHGFTLGIAIIIAVSQVADFSGMDAAGLPADFLQKTAVLMRSLPTVEPAALAIGLFTLALILVLRRLAPRLPGFVIAVVLASAIAPFLPGDVATIGSRFGGLDIAFRAPGLPEFDVARLVELLPWALVIAFLAGMESLLSAVIADRMTGFSHRSDTELVAQGIANTASALFAGLPATGALARTATNVRAGAKTPVAGMAHAAFILAFILIAAPLAAHFALPALAAVLLVAAWGMAEPQHLFERLRGPGADTALLLLTLFITVLVDLTVAIGVGIVLGLALAAWRRRRGA
ncbi:SulP family inorganic anion transporter [Pararhizobium haloflavum]|uniref:SulP family inorganic anion transporter n=1 Tax=Pararhizobium haloflavum TaxID=2037914 RepID=UPI0018E431B4|nr:SulP family inorganic anion transporter [Pararhizobium haloflavum]